jgi:hypothetical protein
MEIDTVMAGPVHVFLLGKPEDVDARHKAGHHEQETIGTSK